MAKNATLHRLRLKLKGTPVGERVAQTAEDPAWTNRFNGEICWNAAIQCLRKAGAVPISQTTHMMNTVRNEQFTQLIPATAPRAQTAQDFVRIPRGSVVGFFETRPSGDYMIHAMIAVGEGIAYGTNNGCIGAGPAWAPVDVAALNWNANELQEAGRQNVFVRYRSF